MHFGGGWVFFVLFDLVPGLEINFFLHKQNFAS